MLCSHFTQNCILYFLEAKNPYFETKNCWKSSYICVFILSKKRHNWFHKNFHNSAMFDCRKLPDVSLNRIFNALSIDAQYTLSFRLTNFGLKWLVLLCTFILKWFPLPVHFSVSQPPGGCFRLFEICPLFRPFLKNQLPQH